VLRGRSGGVRPGLPVARRSPGGGDMEVGGPRGAGVYLGFTFERIIVEGFPLDGGVPVLLSLAVRARVRVPKVRVIDRTLNKAEK